MGYKMNSKNNIEKMRKVISFKSESWGTSENVFALTEAPNDSPNWPFIFIKISSKKNLWHRDNKPDRGLPFWLFVSIVGNQNIEVLPEYCL